MTVNNVVFTDNLGPEFEIGTNVTNLITIDVDGTTVVRDATTGELSSPVTTLGYNAATSQLSYLDEAGNTTTIDLSALTTDIYVNGANFNAATSVLTLTDNDAGTGDVTIDLSALLGVSTDAGNVLTNGTDGKPLLTSAALCADITANCLQDCDITDAFGVVRGTVQQLQ